jgi:hypothetical protein
MELLVVVDAVPSVLVLTVGLIVLGRRRAALGRRASIAIAGVAVLLACAVAHALLGFLAYRAIQAGVFDLPGWMNAAELMMLPADLLGLPLLAWAILAGRERRPAAVQS